MLLVLPILAQDPAPPAATGPLTQAVAQLLHHSDPVVRGEAAMTIAPLQRAEDADELVAIATDEHPAARVRGLLALGWHGGAGSESVLGRALKDAPEGSLERMTAAYAIGALPGSRSLPSLLDYWRDLTGGSVRRHRETVAALLAGLAEVPRADQLASVRNLLFDASNREPALHALALETLARIDGSLDADELARLCRSSLGEDRLGALRWMRTRSYVPTGKDRERIVQLASRDPLPPVRAAALELLMRDRVVEALELGRRALESADAVEARAGLQAILYLGGGAAREALGHRLLAAGLQPRVRSTLLAAFPASEDPDLVARFVALASDHDADAMVRVEAAALAARSGDARAAPLLRELFATVEQPAALAAVVRAAIQLDKITGSHDHEKLLDPVYPLRTSDDARLLAARLEGLLAGGHPGATALLGRVFDQAAIPAATVAEILRGCRLARNAPTDHRAAHLPPELRSLLR